MMGGAIAIVLEDEVSTFSTETPKEDYWKLFASISLERKFMEEANVYYRIPVFSQELQDLEGDEIVLSGYFLPYAKLDSFIIISRYPNSSCFFCGQAGIESVAMVELQHAASNYRMDQIITVKGKLALNNSDITKLAFIVEDAEVDDED